MSPTQAYAVRPVVYGFEFYDPTLGSLYSACVQLGWVGQWDESVRGEVSPLAVRIGAVATMCSMPLCLLEDLAHDAPGFSSVTQMGVQIRSDYRKRAAILRAPALGRFLEFRFSDRMAYNSDYLRKMEREAS